MMNDTPLNDEEIRLVWNACIRKMQHEFRQVGRIQTAVAMERFLINPGEPVPVQRPSSCDDSSS